MDEYLIGAGALLTAGPEASIAGATLHAQMQSGAAHGVKAAVVDFEAGRLEEVSRLLIVAAGWGSRRFRAEVIRRLVAYRECSLADIVITLAEATGTNEVHLFARWLADDATKAELAEKGIGLLDHPLEAIGQAALVCGQRLKRWRPPVRAA
jgi:hypothetical protein